MMVYWLLTSTFYGNWLPGDPRGFVSRVRDRREGEAPNAHRRKHNQPATPCDRDLLGLHRQAVKSLKCSPVRVNTEQALALVDQFRETAAFRRWELRAVAVLANHVHWVVGAEENVHGGKIMADFKAYGSRLLNRRWGPRGSGTWWTYSGSARRLADDAALAAAVRYVLQGQQDALTVWPSA